MSKPDFLCVGMQKSGTNWLFEQLRAHSDFWLPPVKELHFFERSFPRPIHVRNMSANVFEDPRDVAFAQYFCSLERKRHDLATYRSLFAFAGDRITGDMTPYYSTFDDAQVARMSELLPNVKVVLMVRDPISRVWSNLNDAVNTDRADPSVLRDPDALLAAIGEGAFRLRSFPSRTWERWRAHFDARFFRLDDVKTDPVAVRRSVYAFLGANPDAAIALPASHNPKASRPRAEMSDEIRHALTRFFEAEGELERYASMFGAPRELPAAASAGAE